MPISDERRSGPRPAVAYQSLPGSQRTHIRVAQYCCGADVWLAGDVGVHKQGSEQAGTNQCDRGANCRVVCAPSAVLFDELLRGKQDEKSASIRMRKCRRMRDE